MCEEYKVGDWVTNNWETYQVIAVKKLKRTFELTLANPYTACFRIEYFERKPYYIKLSPLISEILTICQKNMSEKKTS